MACFRNVDACLEAAGADIWAIDSQMDKDLRGNTPRKVGAKLTFRGNFRRFVGIRRLLGRSNPKQFLDLLLIAGCSVFLRINLRPMAARLFVGC